MRNTTSNIREYIQGINAGAMLVYFAIFFVLINYSADWIDQSGRFSVALAPLALLVSALSGLIVILGLLNLNNPGTLSLYALAITLVILSLVFEYKLVNQAWLEGLIAGAVVLGASIAILRLIMTYRYLTNILECVVVTGAFFIVFREMVFFYEKLY